MNGTFKVEIELGNDAMSDLGDLSSLLSDLSTQVLDFSEDESDGCELFDRNGNTVGRSRLILES